MAMHDYSTMLSKININKNGNGLQEIDKWHGKWQGKGKGQKGEFLYRRCNVKIDLGETMSPLLVNEHLNSQR